MPKTVSILIGTLGILALIYEVIFGRALTQKENHVGILLTLPEVLMSSTHVGKVDNTTYLSQSPIDFIAAMKTKGFEHQEQLGSAHFFMKNSQRFVSHSRMYSSYFMLFQNPVPQN